MPEARPRGERVERICLKCDKPFQAEGKFNRICKSCKGKIDYNDVHSVPAEDMLPAQRKGVPY